MGLRSHTTKKCIRPTTIGNAVGESLAQQFRSNQGTAPTTRQTVKQENDDEIQRLVNRSYSGLPDEEKASINALAQRANADPSNPNVFITLKEALETQQASGQELSNPEIQRRTNNFLKLQGATADEIRQVNANHSRTGVLRIGTVDIVQRPTTEDTPNRTPFQQNVGDALPNQNTRPPAFVLNRSFDTGIIGVGEVLTEFGQFVESSRVAKFTLNTLDIAAGPVIYTVRTFPPVERISNAVQDKVLGFFADGFEQAGRSQSEIQAGSVGGSAILSLAAGGFVGAAKRIGSLVSDFKALGQFSGVDIPDGPSASTTFTRTSEGTANSAQYSKLKEQLREEELNSYGFYKKDGGRTRTDFINEHGFDRHKNQLDRIPNQNRTQFANDVDVAKLRADTISNPDRSYSDLNTRATVFEKKYDFDISTKNIFDPLVAPASAGSSRINKVFISPNPEKSTQFPLSPRNSTKK